MNIVISCNELPLGVVIHDLSSARSKHVLSLGDDNEIIEWGLELPVINTLRIYAPPDPFGSTGDCFGMYVALGQQRHVTAKGLLKEMLGYLKHLRSLIGR